ncbi:MAG: class I adenylate-forming enzyme family protein [Lacisediminimonas sp.]|nr:class I adenylate-forming enzyme family protein [Lacisediminimonas sp.]
MTNQTSASDAGNVAAAPVTHYKNLGCIGQDFCNDLRPAIIDLSGEAPREISYKAYNDACDAVARGLLKRGFEPGQRIGVLSGNRAEFLEVFYGAMRAGVVPVLINTLQPKDTVDWVIRNSEVKLIFTEAALRALCPADIPSIEFDDTSDAGYKAFQDFGPFTARVPEYDDVAFHAYTSGSTGRPKGAMLSHRAHTWVAETISRDRDFCPDDRMIVAAPLYHKHGMNSIKCVLVGGSTVILMRKFDARKYVENIARYRLTIVSGVPTIFAMMLQQRDLLAGNDYSYVRLATMGGAPASDVLIDDVAALFPKAGIVQIFGITEVSAALFGPHPDPTVPRPRHSIGWPVKGNEFRLVGGADDNFGTLHVRGPGMMNGYVNNPEETAKRLKDGWYNTGDILRRDEDGWYYFIGRSDDMFVSSGHNIYPLEVELMLERHDDIEQAVVVPVPDDIKHRIPVAFIVKRKGSALTEEDVKQHSLKNAPPYQYPRQVHMVDAMPMNTVGKIDRRTLEARAQQLRQAAKAADA